MTLKAVLDKVFPYKDSEVKGLKAVVVECGDTEAFVEWRISPPDDLWGALVGTIHYLYDVETGTLSTDEFSVHTQRDKGVLTRFAAHSIPILSKETKRYQIETRSEPIRKVLTACGMTADGDLFST